MANLVESVNDVEHNAAYFFKKLTWGTNQEKNTAKELIKNGFVYYIYRGSSHDITFIPSRFLGYENNNFNAHETNLKKHGGKTTSKISQILDSKNVENGELDSIFLDYCGDILKIKPKANKRSFWNVDEISNDIIHLSISEQEISARIARVDNDPGLSKTQKQQIIFARIGQGKFRDALKEYWENKCALSNCDLTEILVASHIKPWSVSENYERLDQFNGFLFSPNIDKLFDKGLISFKDDGKIIRSKEISKKQLQKLGIDLGWSLTLNEKHLPYLKYHRENIFIS